MWSISVCIVLFRRRSKSGWVKKKCHQIFIVRSTTCTERWMSGWDGQMDGQMERWKMHGWRKAGKERERGRSKERERRRGYMNE